MESIFKFLSELVGREVHVLKSVGKSPKGLSKFTYVSIVLPEIDKYMITDKADGTRGIVRINKSGAACIVGSEYIELPIKFDGEVVLDCEFVHSHNLILIFDILYYNNQNLCKLPFNERHRYFQDLKLDNKSDWKIMPKKFSELAIETYQKNIMSLHMEMNKYKYKTDGIIFTKVSDSYNKSTHYKWKPIEHLTIDFLFLDGHIHSGISLRMFKQIGLPIPEQNKYFKYGTRVEFFPVKFRPSIWPRAYCASIKNLPPKINDKIIELSWNNAKKEWHFHRIRTDRDAELADGHYYGNNFKIAELTFQSIINPLTLKDLVMPQATLKKGFYFEKSDPQYEAVRKFNSFVKTSLIAQSSYSKKVIDIASGKGQDLARYIDAHDKNLLMLELDISAIDELVSRKYEITQRTWIERIDAPIGRDYQPSSLSLLISQMNMLEPYDKNIKKIEQLQDKPVVFTKGTVPLVVCNMALHYLVGSSKDMNNICEFIAWWLAPGGEFIMTALDANAVSKLPKKWSMGPYKINQLSGKSIEVLLPCSTTMREEPMIDLDALDKTMAKHKIMRVETKSFSSKFDSYKNIERLNGDDKFFAGLYQYCIYKRI